MNACVIVSCVLLHLFVQDPPEPYQNMTAEQRKREKRIIYKNLLLISGAFFLLFLAFENLSKLQSSINKAANLGTWSSTAVYASLILSCMFMPTILIKYLKVKWTLVVSMFCYTTYMAAQFYPEFYTLIPTALILGLGAAPLWSAKCTYLNQVRYHHCFILNFHLSFLLRLLTDFPFLRESLLKSLL